MSRPLRGPLVALLALVLTLSVAVNADAAGRHRVAPGPDRAQRHYTHGEAQGLLAQAERQLRPDPRRSSGRSGIGKGPGTELTTTLVALSRARGSLSGADRQAAENLLARPTNGSGADPVKYGSTRPYRTRCVSGTLFCIHWVTSGPNAISTVDSDHDGIPNYVEYVIATMKYVYNYEVGTMGYRKPLSDAATAGRYRGNPNAKYDIYLAELGSLGLYGYCAPEGSVSAKQLPGYCVLDNNYSPSQYGSASFLNPMRVTAAHEFFHAIQFGYDVDEDPWFMEGTATWIEDEVFDRINDNYQYLAYSPVRYPRSAVDYTSGLHAYGAWIFFRFASEYFKDRNIVRDFWDAADAKRGSQYSLQAIVSTVSQRTSWPTFFTDFGLWNLLTTDTYSERSQYPTPVYGTTRSTRNARDTSGVLSASAPAATSSANLFHSSSSAALFKPASSLPHAATLRLTVNTPDTVRGTAAVVQVRHRDGTLVNTPLALDATGAGTTTIGFDRTTVSSVVVLLADTSTALTSCGRIFDRDGGPLYSCYGKGVHDTSSADRNTFTVRADLG